jgi:hypothetical protein
MRLRAVGTLTEVAGGANAWVEETQNAAAMARFRSIMINKEVEGDVVIVFYDTFIVPPRSCWLLDDGCEGNLSQLATPSALEFASSYL